MFCMFSLKFWDWPGFFNSVLNRIRGSIVYGSKEQRQRIIARVAPVKRSQDPIHSKNNENGRALRYKTIYRYRRLDKERWMLYEAL